MFISAVFVSILGKLKPQRTRHTIITSIFLSLTVIGLFPLTALADIEDLSEKFYIFEGENNLGSEVSLPYYDSNGTAQGFQCNAKIGKDIGLKWRRSFITNLQSGPRGNYLSGGVKGESGDGDLNITWPLDGVNSAYIRMNEGGLRAADWKGEEVFQGQFYFWIVNQGSADLSNTQKAYIEACDKLVQEGKLTIKWDLYYGNVVAGTPIESNTETVYFKRSGEYGVTFPVLTTDRGPSGPSVKVELSAVLQLEEAQSKITKFHMTYDRDCKTLCALTDSYAVIGSTNLSRLPFLDKENWQKYAAGENRHIIDPVKEPDYNNNRIGRTEASTQSAAEAEKAASQGGIFSWILEKLLGIIASILGYIILIINTIIYYVFSIFVAPIIVALLSVHPWNDKFVNVIYPGWLIIRNLTNVAFIISLLVIGLRILFQVEEAATSRTFIKNLIIMALLVNFSLVIGQSVVAIADTVQSQFLPAQSKVVEALAWKLMGEPAQNFVSRPSGEGGVSGAVAELFQPFILLILCVCALFGFIAVAGFIVIRLASLWILYMVSPVAYFGAVIGSAFGTMVPQVADLSKKWWSEFIKYTISVPILAFFLSMTALVATTFTKQPIKDIGITSNGVLETMAGGMVNMVLTVMTHYIVLAFLFAGMKYASASGVKGADALVKFANKGYESTTGAFKKGALGAKNLAIGGKNLAGDRLAGKLDEKQYGRLAGVMQGLFRPKMAGELLKKRAEKEYKKHITEPAEAAERGAKRILTREIGLDQKPHTEEWDKHAKDKEFADKDLSQLTTALTEAYEKANDVAGGAALTHMLKQGGLDEFVDQMRELAVKQARQEKPNISDAEVKDIEQQYSNDANGMRLAIERFGQQTNMTDKDTEELRRRAEASAKSHDKEEYLGIGLSEEQQKKNQERRDLERKRKGAGGLMDGHISKQVKHENGEMTGYSDSQIKLMAETDVAALKRDQGVMSEFRKHANYNAQREAYQKGGRQQLIQHLQSQNVDQAKQNEIVDTYDQAYLQAVPLTTPQPNVPPATPPNPAPGNPNPPNNP